MILANAFRVLAKLLADFPAGGSIGSPATTVDVNQQIRIAQTTAGQTLSLPSPTAGTDGYMISILNTGSASFIISGQSITPGTAAIFHWNGTTWIAPAGTPGSGVTSFNSRTGAVTPASGDYTIGQITGGAPAASPALTGTPTAPTAAPGTNTTQIASTAFVAAAVAAISGVASFNGRTGAVVPVSGDYTVGQITGAAPSASPTFTGVPAAPTAAPGANTTQLATTAFVTAAVAAATTGVSQWNGRTGAVVPVSGDYTVGQVTGAAPLASPTFTGVPAAPTAAPGTNTTQLATTAFVIANAGGGGSSWSGLTNPTGNMAVNVGLFSSTLTATTAQTATPNYVWVLVHDTSVSPSAGLGTGIKFRAKDTAAINDLGYVQEVWDNPVNANRTARLEIGLTYAASSGIVTAVPVTLRADQVLLAPFDTTAGSTFATRYGSLAASGKYFGIRASDVMAADVNVILPNNLPGGLPASNSAFALVVQTGGQMAFNEVQQKLTFSAPLSYDSSTQTLSAPTVLTGVAVQDEGSAQGNVTTFNFVGAGVTATVAGSVATVTISGGGGGSPGGASGTVQYNAAGSLGGIPGSSTSTDGNLTLAPISRPSPTTPYYRFQTAQDTNMAANVERVGIFIGGTAAGATALRNWNTGTVAQQREVVFVSPSYTASGGAVTFTRPSTVEIQGPTPDSSISAVTFTDPFALRVTPTGTAGGGVVINAPSGSTGRLLSVEVNNTILAQFKVVAGDVNSVFGSAALANNATDGFVYLPHCTNTPSGTPTVFAGTVPIVVDKTNKKLYGHDGSVWFDFGAGGGGAVSSVTANSGVIATPTTGAVVVSFALNNASGNFFCFPLGSGSQIVTPSTAALVGTANQVRCALVYLDRRITLDRLRIKGSGASAGNASFGIYSADGASLFVYSGLVDTNTGWTVAQTVTPSTPGTIGPGFFRVAWVADNTSATMFTSQGNTNFNEIMGTGVIQVGTAANAATAGALPSSLGTITLDTSITQWPILNWFKN